MSGDGIQDPQQVALDLARKATDLQCAAAGHSNARVTDSPPTVDELCQQIIAKAEALR